MTGTRITRDGTMMPITTCGGCGSPVAGDVGGEHQIGQTAGGVVDSSGASTTGKRLVCNQIHGLLTEFGCVLLVGPHQLRPWYVRGEHSEHIAVSMVERLVMNVMPLK